MDFGTGCRLGEIIAIKWSDLDLVKQEIKICRTFKRVARIGVTEGNKTEIIEQAPKTKYSSKVIALPSSLTPLLKEHRKKQLEEKLRSGIAYYDNDLIFCNELGQPIDARNLTRSYERALKAANISYRKFHSMRHTYATRLFENGVPLKTIQVLMGHSRLEITSNIYTHVLHEEKIKAVDVLNSCL
jgi:integrase